MHDSQSIFIDKLLKRLALLNEIGIALSRETDKNKLLDQILMSARALTNADAGTLYLVIDDKLVFQSLYNDTLGLVLSRTKQDSGIEDFKAPPLYDEAGNPNNKNIVSCSLLQNKLINIDDAYFHQGFDFAGTKSADNKLGYRSKSFLTIPLDNHEAKVIGVLQLINKKDEVTEEIISFASEDEKLAGSLASQAAIILTNQQLIQSQKRLFEDFIQLIAQAIDQKSPYTSKHCSRVPIISLMLADAVNNTKEGHFKDFSLNEDEYYELKIASWLHDCGKVITPEHVMDKSTKLQVIDDRIHKIKLKMEVLKLNALLDNLKLKDQAGFKEIEQETSAYRQQVDADYLFLEAMNTGAEFVSEKDLARLELINKNYPGVLSEQDIINLKVQRGTLNDEERKIINNHAITSLNMLNSLHYPENLKRVPEIAASHHERIDGKGYPRGLKDKELSIQARILAIADIFEALTAQDRPYKKPKKLSETMKIMNNMVQERHIDKDLYEIFIKSKVHLSYASQYLLADQIDC
jgi:HD-GYP domain-containing protein (c-di-GMP phosphodiesterase class II)